MGSSTTATESTLQVTSVPIDVLLISNLNPRREKKLDAIALQQLADSIRANGILQPLVVRRVGKELEVLAGRRRLEAAALAGLTEVPVVIRELDDQAAATAGVVENEQRAALRPLDSALAVARRLDAGETIEQVAVALGKPRSWVARRANLQHLPPALRKKLEQPGDALREWPLESLELLALLPPESQTGMLNHAKWNGLPTPQRLRQALARECRVLPRAPWSLEDAELVPKAGACSTCPFNSANSPDLFGDLHLDEKAAAGAVCRKPDCWERKVAAFATRAAAAAKSEHGKDLLRVKGKWESGSPLEHEAEGALHAHEYKRVKAGTPGAKPAVVVSGKDIGKVVHVKVEKGAKGAKHEKAKPKPGSAASAKASTERIERRRRAWQVDRALEELCAITPPQPGMLVKLAATFGTGNLGQGSTAPGRGASAAKLQKAFLAAGTTELWAAVFTEKHGLRDQLALRRLQDLDGAHAIVQWLTQELRGVHEWCAVVEASEAEIPAPKSLQGLKQTAPAKREKKAAPAAAEKSKPKKARPARGRKAR